MGCFSLWGVHSFLVSNEFTTISRLNMAITLNRQILQFTPSKEWSLSILNLLKNINKKVFTIALLYSKSTDLTLLWKGVWGVMGIQFFIHSFAQSYGNIIMRECFAWFWYIFNYIFKSYPKEGLLKYVQWANSMINIVSKIPDIINFGYWKLFPEDSE